MDAEAHCQPAEDNISMESKTELISSIEVQNPQEKLKFEIKKLKQHTENELSEILQKLPKLYSENNRNVVDVQVSVEVCDLMVKLRKLFSDPIDVKYHLKLSHQDFHKIIQMGIDAGVPKVVSDIILDFHIDKINHNNVQFLVDAFWILTNISSGTRGQTFKVIECGSVDCAMKIVQECVHTELVIQCLMLVSNVLAEDLKIQSDVLNSPVYDKVKGVFPSANIEYQTQIIQFYYTIVKSDNAKITMEQIETMTHQAMSVLKSDSPEPLLRAVIEYTNEVTNVDKRCAFMRNMIDFFVNYGYVPKLTSLMSHKNAVIQNLCHMSVGNLMLGSDEQTWHILKSSLLHHLVLSHYNSDLNVVQNSLWILSNITAGKKMIETIFEFQFFESMFHYILCKNGKLAIEGLFTLRNIFLELAIPKSEQISFMKFTIELLKKVFNSDKESMQLSTTYENNYLLLSVEILQSILRFLDKVSNVKEREYIKDLLISSELSKIVKKIYETDFVQFDFGLEQKFADTIDALEEILDGHC